MFRTLFLGVGLILFLANLSSAQNLMINGGFDDGGVATATVDQGGTDDTSITGWRLRSLDTATGTMRVVADPTAPSAPNVLELNKTAQANLWVDHNANRVPLIPGHTYKWGMMVKDNIGDSDLIIARPTLFNSNGDWVGFGGELANQATTPDWERLEQTFTCPAGAVATYIEFSTYPAVASLLFDDFTFEDTSVSAAETMEAAHRTITVDGNASDWDMSASQPIHMTNPATKYAATPMEVDIRYAWDETYLYCLIQESGTSPVQSEAADGAAFAAGPWLVDCISPWMNLLGDDGTPAKVGFNPWLGFSSNGRTDLLCARVNSVIETSGATMSAEVLVGSQVATSGTQAAHNRTIEARFQWSSIADVVDADRQPAGGLVAAVKVGYKIGVDPLMVQENYTAQCFLNGQVGTPPSGIDEFSRYIVLSATVPVELSAFEVQ